MSRLLAELLEINPTIFASDIERLENASGQESTDIRLTTEIVTTVRQKSRELGLDPKDTTGRELYHGLMGLVQLHDKFLNKRIGGNIDDSVDQLLVKIKKAALDTKGHKTAWVIKHSVAKRLLKQLPPKKVMKYLGYKSLDSMLKREPVNELFTGILLLESRAWYESFINLYSSLTQMDFETRNIDILCLNSKKWASASSGFIGQQKHIIMSIRELGVIVALPIPIEYRSGFTITILPLLLHNINEIRLYSSFYKLHQMQSDLGAVIAASILNDNVNHVYLAGSKVHWRVVQRHFGRDNASRHPDLLEPHVQPDDFSWRKVETALYKLEPALHFWNSTDYVASFDQKPLSFNVMDMALNCFNNLSYEQRFYGHFQSSLWNELYVRYMGMPALENQVLRQLDYDATDPEILTLLRRNR